MVKKWIEIYFICLFSCITDPDNKVSAFCYINMSNIKIKGINKILQDKILNFFVDVKSLGNFQKMAWATQVLNHNSPSNS